MKALGVAIWCMAMAIFAVQLFQPQWSNAHVFFIYIALLVYLPMLMYNWLWGHQRGHIAHFISIVLAAYLSVLTYVQDAIPDILLWVGVGALVLAVYLVLRKYRPRFAADFRRRIGRDHFAHTEWRIKRNYFAHKD